MRVNFADVEDGFKPIPAGTYRARVTDGELRESGPNSKNPGSEYINWEFTISHGDFEGRKQWLNTSLLPHALFGLKGLIAATGKFTDEELASDDFDFDINELLEGNPEVMIVVNQSEYEGETRNNVKRVKPVTSAAEVEESLLP